MFSHRNIDNDFRTIEIRQTHNNYRAKWKLMECFFQHLNNNTITRMQNKQIKLRKTEKSDLEFFFQFQLDKEANYLAAFTLKDPTDKERIF